ncbi:phage antirepressor Ant [Cellulosilyticum lentocellum]|uniref:Phage antirepressor protein n=1 Tax=Cellulosilyticum lentocellum (strain ATCC 49066 / DSM 5427 / NCIMB 11756 / RHM5) TaxID=642492 RepID=F2JPH0_CELLD|nr:phage antirepressor Ant [Cellulosilyticum lentocellum]ADZ82518.1 phage antirepressor protein [Cellulosilyticum lentocellum DSM 5427]
MNKMSSALAQGDQTPVILVGTDSNEVRITSVELVGMINTFRTEEGNTTEKRHDDLLKSIRLEIETLEKAGFIGVGNFSESSYINKQNKEQPCYSMNKAGVLQMLNKESAVVRYKTVQYIEKLEKENKTLKKDSYMIDDPVERAKAWIKEQEEKKVIELENAKNRKLLEEQEPKVAFANAITASKNSILVRELARLISQNGIQIGEQRLYKWLREKEFVEKFSCKATQKAINLKVLELVERTSPDKEGNFHTNFTTYVTPKGQAYFIGKFLENREMRV